MKSSTRLFIAATALVCVFVLLMGCNNGGSGTPIDPIENNAGNTVASAGDTVDSTASSDSKNNTALPSVEVTENTTTRFETLFRYGLIPARQSEENGSWGFIDINGNFVVSPNFANTYAFDSEGLAVVREFDSGLWGYIDPSGNMAIEAIYTDASSFYYGLAAVQIGDQYGYIDAKGNYIIPLQSIFTDTRSFRSNGLAVARDGNRFYGFIDKTGQWVVPPLFSNVGYFYEGLMKVQDSRSSLWGYVDESGDYVIEAQFGGAEDFSDGLARVQDPNTYLYGYIDKSGKYVIEPKYDAFSYNFSEGIALVSYNGSSELINKDGLPPFDYSQMIMGSLVSGYNDGLAGMIGKDGRQGYIDNTGNYVIEIPSSIIHFFPFSGGYARINDGDLDWSVVGFATGKYGFINKSGEIVIEPQFDDAKDFASDGSYAIVKSGELWGIIDGNGNYLVPPSAAEIKIGAR